MTPGPDEPRFIQTERRGARVHILRDLATYDAQEGWRAVRPGDSTFTKLRARERSYCGTMMPSGFSSGVSSFYDNDLCRRCAKVWPYPRVLLFEHPTPDS